MKEEKMIKGNAKEQTTKKATPSPRKQKVNNTILPPAKEKDKNPPKKSKPAGPTIGVPPKRIPKLRKTSREETEAPMGQVNVEEKDIFEE